MANDRISRAASAAEQLCGALWEAVHEEMRAGRSLEVVALTDRIAEVCRSVSAVANAAGASLSPDAGTPSSAAMSSSATPAVDLERSLSGTGPKVYEPSGDTGRASGVDPLAGASRGDSPANAEDWRRDRRRSGELHIDGAPVVDTPAALVDEHEGAATPIAIRDVRGAEGSSWAESIGRRLDRYADDRVPFAVLLIEVLDAERLRVAEGPAEAHRMIREVEGAIVEQLRPADALLREADGRYWLIAPQTEVSVAGALAQRIASAARRAGSHRGAPLQVSIGVALCPDHGADVATLIAHADIDLYAAQAEGRRFGEDERPPI